MITRQRAFLGKAVAFALVLPFATAILTGELRYRGSQVSDKKTGLTLLPVKIMDAVAVSSTTYHYFVVLPAGEWRFESSKDSPLSGSDGKFEVTLMATDAPASPAKSLEGLLAKLQAESGLEIREPQVLEERGHQILRYQARPAGVKSLDGWQWNYWTIAVDEGYGIVLHLSTMDQTLGTGGEEQRLRTLLTSLRADFK